MSKILHITDLHLNPLGVVPRGRNDSFHKDTANELDAVREFISNNGVEVVLISGDIFNLKTPSRYSPPDILHYKDVFSSWGCPILTIPGNHDLPQSSLSQKHRSPYELLVAATPNIHCLTNESLDIAGVRVYGIPYLPLQDFIEYAHYLNAKLKSDFETALNVVLVHTEVFPDGVSFPYIESISYSRLASLLSKARILCLGHIHKSFDLQEIGGTWLSKPYSMGRVVKEYGSVEQHAPMGTLISTDPLELTYHVFPHKKYEESFVHDTVVNLMKIKTLIPNYFENLDTNFLFKDPMHYLNGQTIQSEVREVLDRYLS